MLSTLVDAFASLLNEWQAIDPAALRAVPVHAAGPEILPVEPSTLALAFVGLGILAAYAVAKRWRRVPQMTAGYLDARAERPKRGAA